MSELDILKQRVAENNTMSKRLLIAGSTVSVGALVLATASVLAPVGAIFIGAVGATTAFVGGVGKLSQPELRSLQQEKVSQVLSQANPQTKEKATKLEHEMEKSAENIDDSMMKASLFALAAVLVPSSFPIVFPAALAGFGIYKACQVASSQKTFNQSVKDISSLHDEVVVSPSRSPAKPKF